VTLWIILALLAFLQTLLAGLLLTPWARWQGTRLGLMDNPTLARKQHQTPIPRAGGVAVFVAFWICLWADFSLAGIVVPKLAFLPEDLRALSANVWLKGDQLGALFIGCATIFILGLLDDRFNLPPKIRLLVQILACLPLVLSGTVLKLFLPLWIAAPITIFWLVLLTNSFNFLDNMNGLTSGISVIIAGVFALQSALAHEYYMTLVFGMLAGAVLGFWFFNFPRASLFLGDSGSTHLGFLFGALSVQCTYYAPGTPTALPILFPLVALGVPVFDTLSVMWIRWRGGKPLMQGDRNHFSHRMEALGMTRTEAVLFIYGVTLCVGLAAVALRPLDWRYGLAQGAVIVLLFGAITWMETVSRRRKPEEP
jgi:UDP-GlcNAc:undecaprenyl-phosphate GlcNAc-1-phosphate transferase